MRARAKECAGGGRRRSGVAAAKLILRGLHQNSFPRMTSCWLTLASLAPVPSVTLNNGAPVPSVTLNNGVRMPALAISLPQTASEAAANIKVAFERGISHFVTAQDYLNQREVGAGLRALGAARDDYFVTTMTSPCQCNQTLPHCKRNITDMDVCTKVTTREVLSDLEQLNLTHVDLLLLHGPNLASTHVGPCDASACAANRAQWRAYSELYQQGKARAIGIGNVCPSCLDCLLDGLSREDLVVPAVTQVQYHVAYGPDRDHFLSYYRSKGVVPHAYGPLANGALVGNKLCASIGRQYNKTAAQVAMRWLVQNRASEMAILTHSTSGAHLEEDVDVFGSTWELSAVEVEQLDAITCETNPELCAHYEPGRMAWGCTS